MTCQRSAGVEPGIVDSIGGLKIVTAPGGPPGSTVFADGCDLGADCSPHVIRVHPTRAISFGV